MIYILILLALAVFAMLYDVLNVREGRSVSYWGSFALLVCLAGFRFRVGGDTYNYMATHELLPDLSHLLTTEVGIAKLQPLWLLFSATAKSIGEEFFVLQFLHAALINGIIFGFIQKNTAHRHTGILFYYLSLYPFFNFEILRESLAVCIFLLAIPHYENKSWLRYYLYATAAFLFHLSAIFLFLLPLIRNLNLKAAWLLLLFLVSTLLNPVVQDVASSSIATDLLGFAIGGYAEYNYTVFGLLSILILYLLIPLLLTWLSQEKLKLKLKFSAIATKGLPIAALIPLLFIFYRFFNYFAILYVLMACEIAISTIKARKIRKIKIVTAPAFLCIAFVFYSGRYFSDTSDIVPHTRWHIRWHPYHSIFDPITVPDRDRMIEIQSMGQQ